jgi:hypothetical protein
MVCQFPDEFIQMTHLSVGEFFQVPEFIQAVHQNTLLTIQ